MKIIAFTKYDRMGASSRVRFHHLIPLLSAKGCEITIVPLLSNDVLKKLYISGRHDYRTIISATFLRLRKWLIRGSFQIIWVEKELFFGQPTVLEKLLFGAEIENTIFDFDDGVYLNYKDIWLGPFGRRAKFGYYARKAGFITVGSEAIGSEMQSLGCRRIAKVPSTVCVGSYSIHQHLALSTVIVGWIGTPKTVRFLDALRDVLPVVAKRCPFKMHVVGAEWDCRGVDVLSLPWSEDTETAMVGRFDIGLMPLIDGPWERAKCGYKLIQYMAAGVVPIGARIGENEVIIQDGVNGYLASEPEEWIKKLLILCGNHQLRSAVGARARETVLAKYDVRIAADAVHEVFTQVVNRQTRSA